MAIMGQIMGSSFGRAPQAGMMSPGMRPGMSMMPMNIPGLTPAPQRQTDTQSLQPQNGATGRDPGGGDFWSHIFHPPGGAVPGAIPGAGSAVPGTAPGAGIPGGIMQQIMQAFQGGYGGGGGGLDISKLMSMAPALMGG